MKFVYFVVVVRYGGGCYKTIRSHFFYSILRIKNVITLRLVGSDVGFPADLFVPVVGLSVVKVVYTARSRMLYYFTSPFVVKIVKQ